MKILADIGGSGARFAALQDGVISQPVTCGDIADTDRLISVLRETAGGGEVGGIALSVPGYVNSERGFVRRSANASYLEGDLRGRLQQAFPRAQVHVVNDGEAHARALLLQEGVQLGAVNLALGTSVAFGALDVHGNAVRALNGENWDIGDMLLDTRAARREVWWALGQGGLASLEEEYRSSGGDSPYRRYGWRLGTFLTTVSAIFRPRTVGLSGGILRGHADEIGAALRDTYTPPASMEAPRIILMRSARSVMEGLSTLL